jgi:flagellar motor switch protein FliN
MNAGAAKVLVDACLRGFAEVLTAWSSSNFEGELLEMGDVSEEQTAAYLARLPVVLRARTGTGGALAVLLGPADAAQWVALRTGGPAGEDVDAAGLQALQEAAGSLLEGIIAEVAATFGCELAATDAEAVRAPADLRAYMDGPCTAGQLRLMQVAGFDSEPVLIYTQTLEALCPPALYADAAGASELSDEEMSEILSGLEVPSNGPSAKSMVVPPNMDMILDINLVVTARLGRVEMPIQDILALGPGSIIEVGHLVDEPVELLVNDKLIARGDVVVVDEKFGLRITEIVSPRERIESLR